MGLLHDPVGGDPCTGNSIPPSLRAGGIFYLNRASNKFGPCLNKNPGLSPGLNFSVCGERGIRTPGTSYPVRQFSKLLVSATHPPLQKLKIAFSKFDKSIKYDAIAKDYG